MKTTEVEGTGVSLFYLEIGSGHCTLKLAANGRTARRKLLQEVGTDMGIPVCRKATVEDIHWVGTIGGNIPHFPYAGKAEAAK